MIELVKYTLGRNFATLHLILRTLVKFNSNKQYGYHDLVIYRNNDRN